MSVGIPNNGVSCFGVDRPDLPKLANMLVLMNGLVPLDDGTAVPVETFVSSNELSFGGGKPPMPESVLVAAFRLDWPNEKPPVPVVVPDFGFRKGLVVDVGTCERKFLES